MKIRLFPADNFGCGYYRMIYPAQALAEAGYDVVVHDSGLPPLRECLFKMRRETFPDGRVEDFPEDLVVAHAHECDAVVIQRPGNMIWSLVIDHLKSVGIKVVVDIDDDFTSVPRSNPAYGYWDPSIKSAHNWRVLQENILKADALVASTPTLLTRFKHTCPSAVVYNQVPSWYFDVPRLHTEEREEGRLTLGWAGNIFIHGDDLSSCKGVAEWVRRQGHALAVVGNVAPNGEIEDGFGLSERVDVCTGWNAIERYPYEVTRLDVGIVPASNNRFNNSKSWLKPLEYSALGVPFVASALPEYVRWVHQGAGILAEPRFKDWTRSLTPLLNDSDYRAEQIDKGRELAKRWTFSEHLEDWWQAWTAWKR